MNITIHPYIAFILLVIIIRGLVSMAQDIYNKIPSIRLIYNQVTKSLEDKLNNDKTKTI